MKENFYFHAMQRYIASGLSVREAHEHFLKDYNSYPHPTAKQLINIINKASRDDDIDPESRPVGLNVKLITDPAEVERRKILTEKVWQIFYAGFERQATQNKNSPQIARDLQRFRNHAIPGREEELTRVFGLYSKSTDDEKKQLYTELMLEFLDFDWDEAIRPKTDSEFVEYYSNPDNYARLQIILEIEGYIEKCKLYQLDNAITESILEVKNKLMGKCTLDLNRLEMISTNVYKNCDPVELYRDPKGLDLFRTFEIIAPLMKVNEAKIACPASWSSTGTVFVPEVASIADYCSFGMNSILEDKLNRLMYSLRGDSLMGAVLSGALVKLPDREAYNSDEQLYKDCVDGTSFFIPNAKDPEFSAIVTITRGGNVRWGYCSKQILDIMADRPKDTFMEWVEVMTPFDETVIPGNEDMYVQKHGLSQETRANIISRNEIEKELTQLALRKNSSFRERLAVRDKTVAELTKTINSQRDGIAETIKNRSALSVFKFRSDLSEHLATVYVNSLVLQQITDKGDTIKVDEINELYNKDFMADMVDTIKHSPGFKHFVENVEIKDMEALTDKSTGSYSKKALADMKSIIEGEISNYVKSVEVPPQNDREKILRWYNSLEETLKLQGVDINNPVDRMRVISSDISYSPDAPGGSRYAVTTDYYAFMDRRVNEDGSLGDYVNPKPFPSEAEQQKRFEPIFSSYLTEKQNLNVAYTNYYEAKNAHASETEIDRLLSQVEECNSKYQDARNAYTEYWDKLIAPTNKWLLTGTRKFNPDNPDDFKFIENLYNNSKDGFLRLQTLGRNSQSMIQIGVGKDGLAKTGVNFLEVPDADADPYGEVMYNISQSRNGNPELAEYTQLPPLKKIPKGLENDRDAITVVTEANKIIEAQYDNFLKNRLDKYYPDVESSARMINALAVIGQNNFMVPPSDGTHGFWSELFYAEFMKHYNIFTNEMHDNPESYDSNGMRKPEISNKFRDEHLLTEGEKQLDNLVEQALYTKMANTAVRPYKSLELEEMRSKTEELKAETERRKQARLDAEKQAFFSDKAWSMVSTKELMKKIGNLYEKNTDFGSKIFTVACMKNRLYDRNGEVNENALSDVETLNGINRLISLASGDGNISEEDKAFLADLEARAQEPIDLPQAFDSMVSMLASTMDFKHDFKDITSPAQAYVANMYLNLHNRYPETNINGELVSVNGQDCSVSHPDEREAYLVLGSQVSGIQKVYAEFRSELDNKELDGAADLSIKRDRDLLLEGQAAPDMPSVKDYMTFVRKEIKENAYFTPHFDNISKSFESYEYDKFKAKMNFEKWVKKEKGNLLKQENKGEGSYLAHKAKLAAKQCIITEVLRNIVGKDKDISKALNYFAQPTDEGFRKSFANLGTFCETLKKNPDRIDQLLNLEFESYRVIDPKNHVTMQIELLNRDNCRAESYMRDLFDVQPGDGSGMFKPENAERAREYEQWHQSAMNVKMEVPDRYKDIANFIIMGSFFSREIMNDEWIQEYGKAGGSSGFLCTYDSALSNFFECTITGDNRANMQIIRKNEMAARLMANRIMASNDPNQVKEALKTAARTLFENIRIQGKTLKDEYRVAHKYLNELIQKADKLGLHDEDLGITPDMREKINLYDNIAKVNRQRIEAVNKVHKLYRENFFTGVDISNNPELKEATARAHGCNNLMMDLITEFKSKKLVHENETYFINRFRQKSYDEESRVEIVSRAHNTPLSAIEKAFNVNPDGFIEKYIEAAKTDVEKDFAAPKLEDRLNKVLKARDPAIVTSMDTCSPKEFLKSMQMFERNAHFFDAVHPEIAREMRSISTEANRCLTEDGAFNELNINQLMQRINLLGNVTKIKGSPKNEVDFLKEQLNNVAEGYKMFKEQTDAYKVNLSNIEKIMVVPAGTYASQMPAPSQITERGVFRIGENIPENYNLNTMFNELKQVSLIHGSKEFKALSDGIKELITFNRRNGNFLNDASKCEEFKEILSLVSNAAGVYADKKSKDPDILKADTNTSKRFRFAQRVLRATNVMERKLTQNIMRNLEHNAAENVAQNAEHRPEEAHIGPAPMN